MEKTMEINGKTRLIGLIGNPVEHTLSPVIHNGISERMGINSCYMPFLVESDGLEAAVRGAYELNVLGMNVTVPHKNQVMDYLIDVDEAAKAIGAVNTLVRVEVNRRTDGGKYDDVSFGDVIPDDTIPDEGRMSGGFKGYNTDMMGLRRQIKEDGIDLMGQTVVVLGAGGASKAVVYMCMSEGAKKVYLLNRTLEKAVAIADNMKGRIIPLLMSDYDKITEKDLIVFQATSVGLGADAGHVVIEDEAFYRRVKVGVDLIYNPAYTTFMKMVRSQGGSAYNALKMLLYQGVIAYELWHDIKVPADVICDVYVDLKRKVYPKDNIVLIGFMGSGKTTFGKAFAKRSGMDFLDTDEYIEREAGKSISDIFKENGEEYFRELETKTLMYLRDNVKNTVFATGGGMPLRKENARLLKEIGQVMYLSAASSIIYERVKNSTNRPLLQCDNPYERICGLMKERKPLYEAACDVVVDTNSNDLEEIVNQIEIKWRG